jgi:hypothetical protein
LLEIAFLYNHIRRRALAERKRALDEEKANKERILQKKRELEEKRQRLMDRYTFNIRLFPLKLHVFLGRERLGKKRVK